MARYEVRKIVTTTHREYDEVDVWKAQVDIPDDTPPDEIEKAVEEAASRLEGGVWDRDRLDRRNDSGWDDEDEDEEYEMGECLIPPDPSVHSDPAAWAAAHAVGRPEDHGLKQAALL